MKLFGLEVNKYKASKYAPDTSPLLVQVITAEGDMLGELEDYSLYDNQAKAFNQFVWVYAAVTRIAETCAMISFNVYKRVKENLVPETDHEFERLILNPSPFMSRFELWEQTIIHLELQGNAYWFLDISSGVPTRIEVLRPQDLEPHPHPTKFIDYYKLRRDGRDVRIPSENIVHFKRYHPRKKYVGLSAIEASTRSLQVMDKIFKYNNAFFGNNATPRGILITDAILTPEVQKRIENAWRERFKGEESAHKTALMMGGVKFQPVSIPPKDAEFVVMSEMTRDEILAIYGVSTANLGIVKDVNKSNAEAMYHTYIRDTIRPKLIRLSEKITSDVLQKFYGPTYVGKFDEVSTESVDQKLGEMSIVAKSGVMTANEYRIRYLNLPPVPGGDILMSALGAKSLEDFIGDIHGYEYNEENSANIS